MGGGVFTYLVDLANELADSFDIYIAFAIRPQTPEDYRNKFKSGIHLIKVKNFTRSINPVKDIQAFFEIKNIASRVKPDIIHLHSSKAGVLGRWAFDGKDVPLFYTPHGYSFLMSDYGIFKRTMFKIIEKVSAHRNCKIISCSEGEHKESLKLTKNAIYIDNGINTEELHKLMDISENFTWKGNQKVKGDMMQDNQMKHRFTVFTLGRICYQKNPKLFNDIALALPDVRFLWIGDGEMRDELYAPNIEITGWKQRAEAVKLSMPTDVFLLTSFWEGLPMSLLEAMYMKKICVVSDVIGNRDVISNGRNGFVCTDKIEYISAIKAAENGICEEMIEQARHDVDKLYNTVRMARKYKEIYEHRTDNI